MKIFIRPLSFEDAKTSYKWRNDPVIWKYTGSKPDRIIQYEDELEWISNVLSRDNEKRFAIIADDNYVGNVQLTDITRDQAVFQIFIGNQNFWGKGVAFEATRLIISVAFKQLKLKTIKLRVRKGHERAISLYTKIGFQEVSRDEEFLTMIIKPQPKYFQI